MNRLVRLLAILAFTGLEAGELRTLRDIAYKDDVISQTPYEQERCKLDLTLPADAKGFPTYVWFYGGGLKNGGKDLNSEYCVEIRASLARAGVAVVTPDYRLSPKVKYPAYVDDAAAAFAWTVKHIAAHGGDPRKVFIGGHSAGGYLALLVGMDPERLKPHGLTLGSVAGIAQVSGQVFNHYTVREERGQARYGITSDEAAPAFHIRKSLPPILTIYAQNDMLSRAEENMFFVTTLKAAGHTENYSLRVDDRDHGTVGHNLRNDDDPARLAILNFIAKQSANR
ncbi:MAG: alpha/beta hydrolase [Verrucomicrobiota bacterium]|jgi:acetyl esterase/lipase